MQRVFRRAGRVTLFPAEGEPVMGYGLIAPFKRDGAEIGGLRHLLGELSRPLYRFIGYFEDPAALWGGELEQHGQRYAVLDVKKLALGEHEICLRVLVERRDGDDGHGAAGSAAQPVYRENSRG